MEQGFGRKMVEKGMLPLKMEEGMRLIKKQAVEIAYGQKGLGTFI